MYYFLIRLQANNAPKDNIPIPNFIPLFTCENIQFSEWIGALVFSDAFACLNTYIGYLFKRDAQTGRIMNHYCLDLRNSRKNGTRRIPFPLISEINTACHSQLLYIISGGGGGGAVFKNTNTNKFSFINKLHMFQRTGKIFCILYGISKGTFEIPHKIVYPYIEGGDILFSIWNSRPLRFMTS